MTMRFAVVAVLSPLIATAQTCTLCKDGSYPALPTEEGARAACVGKLMGVAVMEQGDDCDAVHNSDVPQECGCPVPKCSLCENDVLPLDSFQHFIPGYGKENCTFLLEQAAMLLPPNECRKLRASAVPYACGCPDTTPPCTMCPNGRAPVGDALGDIDCKQLEQDAYFLDSDQCRELHNSGVPGLCGCLGPDEPCTLCPDGSFVGAPDKLVPNEPTQTCGELEAIMRVAFSEDSDECKDTQHMTAFACECPQVSAPCPLCYDHSEIPIPHHEVLPGITCSDVADALAPADLSECAAVQATTGIYCGCPSRKDKDKACRLCGDDTLLPDPTRLAKNFQSSCGLLEFEANLGNEDGLCHLYQREFQQDCCGDTCGGVCPNGELPGRPHYHLPDTSLTTCLDLDRILKSSADNEDCTLVKEQFAYYCACPGVEASCPLCQNGRDVPNPDLVVVKDQGSCGDLAVRFALEGEEECLAIQATGGLYCGCDNVVEDSCRLCENETMLPDPGRLVLGAKGTLEACGILEFESNLNATKCTTFREYYGNECCKYVPTTKPSSADGGVPLVPLAVSMLAVCLFAIWGLYEFRHVRQVRATRFQQVPPWYMNPDLNYE